MRLEFGKGEGSNLAVAAARASLDQRVEASKDWLKGLTNEEANVMIQHADEMSNMARTPADKAIGSLAATMMILLALWIREELEDENG